MYENYGARPRHQKIEERISNRRHAKSFAATALREHPGPWGRDPLVGTEKFGWIAA
jgi:hypothetical protein